MYIRQIRGWFVRLAGLLNRERQDQEFAEELESNLQMHIEDNLHTGLTAEEARRQALIKLGGIEPTKERYRQQRRLPVIETIINDLRFGFRLLRKNPGFTGIAVLTLALGIGANTAIFSLIDTVLLRPLAFPDADRMVMVWEDASFAGFPRNTPAPANYKDWKAQTSVFEDMAATRPSSYNLTGDGEPEKVESRFVTANFFSLLGVKPALGHVFATGEDQPGQARVVVISHGLWQSRFGGEHNIIGKKIRLNDESYTVVGVMPSGFQYLDSEVVLWVPFSFTQEQWANRGAHFLDVIGKMKPGVTLEQANADLQTVMGRIAQEYPDEAGRLSAFAVPLREELSGDARRPFMMLLVAVGFVLLIACANIGNLQLSRMASRSREVALRLALGASRWQIVRQFITESLLLSALGAGLGIALAIWSFTFLKQLIPTGMMLSANLTINAKVLLFTLLISLLSGVIFGIAPALQASKTELNESLKQGGGRGGFNAASVRLRSIFVIGEIALSLVLLVGASLLIKTLYQLHNQYAVLQADKVLTLRTVLSPSRYGEYERRVAFYDQVLERVKHLPGVVFAGYTTTVPLASKGGTSGFYPEGQELRPELSYDANHRQVSADCLRALGIPLRQGRYFDEGDNAKSQPVSIINETMARQYWSNREALGKRFNLGGPDSDTPWITVVGIVADVRQMGIDAPVKAEMYIPYRQISIHPWFTPRDLVIRTAGEPISLVAAVRDEVHAVDPNQPISNIRTMEDLLGEESASRRVGMTLLAAFAGLALLLASLGIYGVLSHFVAQRTPEIGVRLALGAQRRDIQALVLGKGVVLTLFGVGVGLLGAFVLTRLMASLLFEVSATDLLTFMLIPLLLVAVALLACYIPARRATKVDPIVALRYE